MKKGKKKDFILVSLEKWKDENVNKLEDVLE
jgi:hypothetical protein